MNRLTNLGLGLSSSLSRQLRVNPNFNSSLLRHAFSAKAGSKEHLADLVKKNKVVVFMKGVPEQPKCGFSNAVVQVFKMHGVTYDSYDVLSDEAIRQGVKDFTEWPTIPQVFINGEFVGGCDILLEMHKNGELIETLQKAGIKSSLVDAVKAEGPKK